MHWLADKALFTCHYAEAADRAQSRTGRFA